MSNSTQTIVDVQGHAAWIRLNRPDRRNALSPTLMSELFQHLQRLKTDPSIRAIVLTGVGSAFCAGIDLKSDSDNRLAGEGVSLRDLLSAILDLPKPVIAAINGPAMAGGIGLIAAADLAIAVDTAEFAFTEVRLGVIPAIISVVCLPKIGRHHAMRYFLTGERFSAAKATEIGLCHQSVTAEQFTGEVMRLVELLSQGGPDALAECKRLVHRIAELPREQAFEEAEAWSQRLFRSAEAQEGIAAFTQKRKPFWSSPPIRGDDVHGDNGSEMTSTEMTSENTESGNPGS